MSSAQIDVQMRRPGVAVVRVDGERVGALSRGVGTTGAEDGYAQARWYAVAFDGSRTTPGYLEYLTNWIAREYLNRSPHAQLRKAAA